MNPVTAWLLLCATWNMGLTQIMIDLAEGWDL
jgi:hypothetical protein